MDKHVTYSVLANSFRKCGLYPWDPTVPRVAGHKNDIAVQNAMENDNLHSCLKYAKQGFQFLNESMGKDILNYLSNLQLTGKGILLTGHFFCCGRKLT